MSPRTVLTKVTQAGCRRHRPAAIDREALACDGPRLRREEVDRGGGDVVRVQEAVGERLLSTGELDGRGIGGRALGPSACRSSRARATLTRMPSDAYIAAMDVARAMIAPLAAAYAWVPNRAGNGVAGEDARRQQDRASARACAAAIVHRLLEHLADDGPAGHAPGSAGSGRASCPSRRRVTSWIGPSPNRRPLPPATANRPSIRPKRSTAEATPASTAVESERSATAQPTRAEPAGGCELVGQRADMLRASGRR